MGSLFKLRDHWTFKADEEHSGQYAVAVANVDNHRSGAMKIVVGSFQGRLRVFDPKQKGFQAEDVLLEQNFREPILSIICGNFLPNNKNRNTLAILFPRRIVIASVTRVGSTSTGEAVPTDNNGGDGSDSPKETPPPTANNNAAITENFFLKLTTHMEHRFEHTTCNVTSGCFGNSSDQEMLCVQSMDGQLTFVDHNKLLFQRFLPSAQFLIPGALAYLPKQDALLVGSSSFELHCFRYKALTQSVGSESKDNHTTSSSSSSEYGSSDDNNNNNTSTPAASGRRVAAEWVVNLGDDILDIRPCRFSKKLQNSQVDIVVLCERTLVVLSDTGEHKFQKRLDASSLCCVPYAMPDGKTHQLLVGSHSEHVVVHSEAAVVWRAKCPSPPIALHVATLCSTQGMIVALFEDGSLTVNYLGTDPANNPIQALESKDLDYDAIDEEHRRLQTVIRQAIGTNKRADVATDVLQLVLSPPTITNTTTRRVQTTATITNVSSNATQKVSFVVHATEPIVAEVPHQTFESIAGMDSLKVPITIIVAMDTDAIIPTSLNVDVVVAYTTHRGENLTVRSTFAVPLALVATPVPPLRNTAFKVQIDTNKAPPPPLEQLFSDLAQFGEIAPNVLSIQYCNGSDATVLVSKNAGRYRVQSSTFEGLWLLSQDLVRRLNQLYRNDESSSEPLRLDAPEGLPSDEFLGMIDVHCAMRTELATAQKKLADEAQQFRAIQKRLLVRYRDRNPASMTSLQLLFEETYRRLHLCSDEVEIATSRLRQACAMLSSSTYLMLLMLHIRCQDTLTKADKDMLRQYITPIVPFNPSSGSLGWEEMIDANITHLLRTSLSRNAKESSSSPQPLVACVDGSKVKKHLTILFDRLLKGATLANTQINGVEVQ